MSPDVANDDLAAHARRLLHDVGKYIARTARNVAEGQLPPDVLRPLLLQDLYALDGTHKASALFHERALPLRAVRDDARLDRVEALLARADAIEADVRAGEDHAVLEALAICREVESTLRALAAGGGGEA